MKSAEEDAVRSWPWRDAKSTEAVNDQASCINTSGKDTKQLAFNFSFRNRNRRPPTDPVNAMLSLAYSMLAKDCTLAALAVGFDPYLGFYHQPRFGRPALGLDLMEEFEAAEADFGQAVG